ncbi:MAG: Flagellin FlaB1 [Dehalococcoidia bacterium]|nr:Flagellin FlaB1 [Dehalococcoidia bacterium]
MLNRLRRLHRDQRGITGLETAIILIAFVVVASVFAYTVLSAGIFSSEKGKEAIYSGLQTARGSMELVGPAVARDTDSDNDIDQLIFTVANALDGEPIDLTTTTDSDADGILSDEATQNHVTLISYLDKSQRVDDITWSKSQIGKGDDDNLLEPGEKMEITVVFTVLSPALEAYDEFTVELKPDRGSSLTITRTIPAVVDDVMDLR